jgi:hypothetical protein
MDAKIAVARGQLGTALSLFLDDKDPVSVHSLAAGAAELLYGIGKHTNAATISSHLLKVNPDLKESELTRLRSKHWNAFKHLYELDKKTLRDDEATIAEFSDIHNDALFFTAWGDYGAITNGLPIAAQVFQVWWYATNEESLAPGSDLSFRTIFPDLMLDDRREKKRRLRRAIEKYRHNAKIISDPRTQLDSLMSRVQY